ncbi:MAG TPA: hypothetical protein VIH61_08195 [Waddliaceae bacterium]
MLKLERHPRLGSVDVIFRHQDNLLTPRFLFALCLAVFIHLIGFLLFQIKPYFVRDAARVYPPVEIVIDFGIGEERMVEAQISGEKKLLYSFELPNSVPTFPLLPLTVTKELLYHQNVPLKNDPFAKLTEELIDDEFFRLDKIVSNSHPPHPVDIHISGNLSRLKIIDEGWLGSDFPGIGFGKKAKNYHAVCDVKVDDRTGRIFWQEHRNPLKKTTLIAYADEILSRMKFEKNPHGFITEGQVEIIFYHYD